MTQEEIKAAVVNYYPKCESPTLIVTLNEDDIIEREQQAFTAGAEWAAGEIEKDAQEFAEWCFNERYYLIGGEWSKNPFHTDEVYHTTSELYQIFKQQKP